MRTCYNNSVMLRKTSTLWLQRTALGLLLLIGFFPISSMLTMQAGHMQMTQRIDTVYSNGITQHDVDVAMQCCSGIVSSTCSFVIPHSAFATYCGGTDQVALSTFSIQSSNRETVTPPPKI